MRRPNKLACIILAAVSLASCVSFEGQTPAQKLYAAQAEFNIHQRVLIVYLSRPECAPGVVVCAPAEVKASLKSMVVRIRHSLAAARAALGTLRADTSVAAAAGLVRDLAEFLARKEIADESQNLSHDPSPARSDRARRHARARNHGELRGHQRQDS